MKLNSLAVFVVAALLLPSQPDASLVKVRQQEGLVHGFLSLKSPEGKILASGDWIQNAHGSRVNSRLVYYFRDGSLYDERAVFTQRGHFRLVSAHLVQRGRSFPHPLDMKIDVASGRVSVRYRDDDGEEEFENEQMDLPPDLANGLLITLLKNVRHTAVPESVSMVVATPKPRLVKLKLSVSGIETFTIAGSPRKAAHYVIKVDIGGLTGLLAKVFDKEPPDSHIWIMEGEAPAFVKSQAQMFMNGPLWQTELVGPGWPRR